MDQSPDELPEEEDPRHHALKIAEALREIERHVWEDTTKINDPTGKVLFETAAEVLGGLATALDRFAAGATT